ncbi:hypothetical protein RPMA_18310 [Tardiphaga alba]|uniref:Bacteriophage tail tape measure C-terminal domain-containing protein n=1 Tax=Tardiphaga alba TaxID=340268 RepID=A0ABX8AA51_9BRAD|nr:hypothetical protein [Tardiphaga alba]QUS40572.1 hypothetical protein RPMA_18310 [Tardiphaga alba]
MAGAAVIGALRVVLGADTASFDKGLKDSQSSLATFGSLVQTGLAAVAAAALAAGAALGVMVKHAIDNADNLNKMSQSTGVGVEALSKLSYAAELADVSQESLGKSLGKLSKAMVSAATDGASAAGEAFSKMGVSVKNTDGTLRSSGEVLTDVADKFSGYRDGADKTALAISLFGKAGASMIPLLNLGKEGLEQAGEEAEKYGLVLDKKTTAAAEAFNDNLKRMDKIKQGLVATLTAQLLPSFEHFSEVMLDVKSNSTLMNGAVDAVVNTFKTLVTVSMAAITAVKSVGAEFGAVYQAVKALASGDWQGFKAGMEAFAAAERQTDEAGKELAKTIANLWSAPKEAAPDWTTQLIDIKSMQKEVSLLGAEWGKTAAPIVSSEGAVKNALVSFLDAQAKRTAAQTAEAQTIGKSVGEQAKLRIEYEAQAIALSKNIALGPAQLAMIQQAGDAAAMAAMKVAGANATLQAMNPTEQFNLQMTQLTQLYDAGVISMETYAERQKQIAEQAGATWAQAGESMAGSFASIANAFGKESSAMATAAKVFGVIQGTISMFTGAAKALELPFPANIAAVAAVMAKGASLVASIKGTTVPTGFKDGLSMTVPGGVGGGDSRLFQAMVEPGEKIDITPNRGGNPSRDTASVGNTYNVGVPLIASRDWVRAMFEALNEGMADGHRLNVVPV